MNDEFWRVSEAVATFYFKALYQHLWEEAEKNHYKRQLRELVAIWDSNEVALT
jgi:hypothetical protein